MEPALLINILLLAILGLICFGLSVLKRQLLRLADRLSCRALEQRSVLPNPSRDFC